MQPYESPAAFPITGADEKALQLSQKAARIITPVRRGEVTRVAYSAAKSQSVK